MTLILVAGSPIATVLVSDRRLTSNGRLVDDESNKAFVVTSRGARLVAAFTGLARAGSFETQTWLMESLSESMKVDGRLRLHRLCEIADRDFRSIGVSRADQLITVVLAGYVADGTDPDGTPTYPSLTWFTNGTTPSPWPLPTETVGDFTFGSVRNTTQNDFENCYSLGLGWVSAIPQKDIDGLTMMARAKKPPAAWVGTALDLIRHAADSQASAGTIGKRCSSIVLPADPGQEPIEGYYTDVPTKTVHLPARVTPELLVKDIQFEILDEGKFAAVPKVGRNQPCPCGSGLKYKRCHGGH